MKWDGRVTYKCEHILFILDKDESRLQKLLECGMVVIKDKRLYINKFVC